MFMNAFAVRALCSSCLTKTVFSVVRARMDEIADEWRFKAKDEDLYHYVMSTLGFFSYLCSLYVERPIANASKERGQVQCAKVEDHA